MRSSRCVPTHPRPWQELEARLAPSLSSSAQRTATSSTSPPPPGDNVRKLLGGGHVQARSALAFGAPGAQPAASFSERPGGHSSLCYPSSNCSRWPPCLSFSQKGASGNASPHSSQRKWVGGAEPSTLGPPRPWSTCRGSAQLPGRPGSDRDPMPGCGLPARRRALTEGSGGDHADREKIGAARITRRPSRSL